MQGEARRSGGQQRAAVAASERRRPQAEAVGGTAKAMPLKKSHLLQQRAFFGLGFGFFRWDNYGGGHFVVGLEVEEFDALGAAAGGADALGVDANDLAELADRHQLAGVVHQVDRGDLARLRRRLHVDDTRAAAALETILVHVSALAKAVLGDRQNEAWSDVPALGLELLLALPARLLRRRDGDADDVVRLAQGDALDAVRRTAH